MGLILLIILIVLLVGALPTWPYSRQWGYRGSSVILVLLILLIVLILSGHVIVFPPTGAPPGGIP